MRLSSEALLKNEFQRKYNVNFHCRLFLFIYFIYNKEKMSSSNMGFDPQVKFMEKCQSTIKFYPRVFFLRQINQICKIF